MTAVTRRRAKHRRPPARTPQRHRRVRIPTDPRFSRRRKAVARSRHRRLLMRISVACLLLVAPWAAFASPLLRVRAVEVVGARHTDPDDVVDAAELTDGDNLLLLSADDVVTRVGDLPWIKAVEVDRMLPGTVRIRIAERRAALVLSLGAARWTVDDGGRVLEPGIAQSDLPTLAGVQVGTVSPGVELRTEEATGALRVWRSLPASLADDVEAIFAPTVERITLALSDGTQVRYGAPEEMASKNEVLTVLRARLAREESVATYIDVRVPSRPAVAAAPPEPQSSALTAVESVPSPSPTAP
jgi:cell division protein FtsQ